MMGLPLMPCHEFPADAPAAFCSFHAMKDPRIVQHLETYIATGRPLLVTDGLAEALSGKVKLDAPNVRILQVNGKPAELLGLPQQRLDDLRAHLLSSQKIQFRAPNKVGLYVFADGSWVIENFNDAPVSAQLDGTRHEIAARGWSCNWK
jgi:hypothetical protein